MTAGNARKAWHTLAKDTVVAGIAAREVVKALDQVPGGNLSWTQRRVAKKTLKKLTWVGVLEISLKRLIEDREILADSKKRGTYYATVVAQEAETIRDLITKIKEVGDAYVLRPDGTYAWLALNRARLDELEEMLTQLTA